jgi:hypothetical protein
MPKFFWLFTDLPKKFWQIIKNLAFIFNHFSYTFFSIFSFSIVLFIIYYFFFFQREREIKKIKKYIKKIKDKIEKVLKRKSHFFDSVKCGKILII